MHHLHQLLDANRAFALNGRGTTNHCPMALHALHEMGASPARLQRFFAHWQASHALPGVNNNRGMKRRCSLSGCVSSWQHGWLTRVGCPPLATCWSRGSRRRAAPFIR